jgi:hypothetical protein
MNTQKLHLLVEKLEAAGIDSRALKTLELEIEVNEKPPGFIGKAKQRLNKALLKQWANIVGEISETQEAFVILGEKIKRKERLTATESDRIRSQLSDLVKVLPAGIFAAANAALPIPGTSVLTPMLLSKMGLMPSRWRDAHMLETLRKETNRLREDGLDEVASELDSIKNEIEEEGLARELVYQSSGLLTHWDTNQNGVWDDDEKESYERELKRLRTVLSTKGAQNRWFVKCEKSIWGPFRIAEVVGGEVDLDETLLVCFNGTSGWVSLRGLIN